jgi:hypothetical protein
METRYKLGDYSPCGTLRFWQYQSYISKKTGTKAERWVDASCFENYKKRTYQNQELSAAKADYIRMQQSKHQPTLQLA